MFVKVASMTFIIPSALVDVELASISGELDVCMLEMAEFDK